MENRSKGAGGWFVSGATGGKNVALKRTLEIIEEQKMLFAEGGQEKWQKSHSALAIPAVLEIDQLQSNKIADASNLNVTKSWNKQRVPLITSSMSSTPSQNSTAEDISASHDRSLALSSSSMQGSVTVLKNIGVLMSMMYLLNNSTGRRMSHRLSATDEINFNVKRHRKMRLNVGARRHTQRRWKTTSMALGGFGKS
ncbi:unnamed protein product [Thelazia callipaeda]|uniref:Uncharacterized protein n=1 Tax=Thelazia callipaeda TaxID=103827 RepID=A0A0N5CN86_THECL|nr:unnamed protein product [Thelazia callipaeda]